MTAIANKASEENFVTPLTLGGSKFRRKTIVSSDISSPVTLSRDSTLESQSISLFSSQQSTSQMSEVDSHLSITSFRCESSTSVSTTSENTSRQTLKACTSSGKIISISKKPAWKKILRAQEKQAASKAQKEAFYGINIHRLLDDIEAQPVQSPHQG
jgi:hypothetical protein